MPTPTDEERVRYRADYADRQRAQALGWSQRQADLVAAAEAGQLRYDHTDTLRLHPQPGVPGRPLAPARVRPLAKAGFVTPSGDGRQLVVTDDGRAALRLWRRWRPLPIVKDRKAERSELPRLPGGQEEARWARVWEARWHADRADAAVLQEAIARKHAWEDRDERLYSVWARVHGIVHRHGRDRPDGWLPTDEEVREHHIEPALLAELREEITNPQPCPEIPWGAPQRVPEPPPLPPAAGQTEQLDLFGDPS